MIEKEPRFSSDDATPTTWTEARERLERAEVYWLLTVRPDGRPHLTPLLSIWLDGMLYFCTGPDERKAKNFARNPHCILATGCNVLDEGLDIVVEGEASRVTNEAGSVASPMRTSRSTAEVGASRYATAPFTTIRGRCGAGIRARP